MTTITMTWKQWTIAFHNCLICEHVPCNKKYCPIWKRAERREKHPLKDASTQGKSVRELIEFIEQAHKNADKSKLRFGPAQVVGGGVVNVIGRSGTPLVKDGKIVRMEKKRMCKNCGDFACIGRGSRNTGFPSWKSRRQK